MAVELFLHCVPEENATDACLFPSRSEYEVFAYKDTLNTSTCKGT